MPAAGQTRLQARRGADRRQQQPGAWAGTGAFHTAAMSPRDGFAVGRSFASTATLGDLALTRPAPSPLAPLALLLQVIQPINGDPFIGMLETPVTSSPLVASYLSNLPAYRTGVSPLLRGVEIGLAHGFLLVGPFIKLGPLRNVAGVAEVSGSLSAAGLVVILALCLSIYGSVSFQNDVPAVGVKTLSGRNLSPDPLQSSDGWSKFAGGWAVGGLAGVAWGYILTQTLPYYS